MAVLLLFNLLQAYNEEVKEETLDFILSNLFSNCKMCSCFPSLIVTSSQVWIRSVTRQTNTGFKVD